MTEKELRDLADLLERATRIVAGALGRLDGQAAVMPSRIDFGVEKANYCNGVLALFSCSGHIGLWGQSKGSF